MNKVSKLPLVLALIAIVIAIGGYFFPAVSSALGARTPGTEFPHGITVGLQSSSPTNLGDLKAGTCALISDYSIASSSTAPYDCAVTGVVPTDTVLSMAFATTTANGVNQVLFITGFKASTTAGYITAMVRNSGAGIVPSSIGAGSSTAYLIARTQ